MLSPKAKARKKSKMYKSKLQELCHRRRWALPRYTYVKDGKDHSPNFKASVVVNCKTFDTPAICKRSKEAINEAAKAAFLHFNAEPTGQRSDNGQKDSKMESPTNLAVKYELTDGEERFRTKLQIYAREKNLHLPLYFTTREGMNDHCFRTKVKVGEEWFQSQVLHKTVEEAEDSAAEEALSSLTMDEFHENDPCSYKNLLRNLTEDEGLLPPIYKTKDSDEPRYRTFCSIVEAAGVVFQGGAAKSKKLAELNAAKAAYSFFVERKLFEPSYFLKSSPCFGSVTTTSDEAESLSSFGSSCDIVYLE